MNDEYKILEALPKLNVFNYKDPVQFLLDTLHQANELSPNGFDDFVNKLQLSNSRIFFDIIKKRKSLLVKHTDFLQNALQLPETELRYFRLIIKYSHISTPIEREFFKQLIEREKIRATTDEISNDLFGVWTRTQANVIGDSDGIPPPFARDDSSMYIDEAKGELNIFTEPFAEKKAWTQFIPYNLKLKSDKVNHFKFNFGHGILPEVDYYTVNQVAENVTLIDVRWYADDRWGVWKTQLTLDASKNNLYANIFTDGSLWGQGSSQCHFSR